VLPCPLIVSRQLARFTPSHSSLRSRCLPLLPRAMRSTPNSHGIISFADPHLVNTVVSYRYENRAREGVSYARALTPFRINTCESVSKQTTLTIFRMNTSEKQGGGWPVIVNQTCDQRLPCGTAIIGSALPPVTSHQSQVTTVLRRPRIMSARNQGDDSQ